MKLLRDLAGPDLMLLWPAASHACLLVLTLDTHPALCLTPFCGWHVPRAAGP